MRSPFIYKPNRQLSRLAWLAEADALAGVITVQHGSDVETNERFFIEGTWSGCYRDGAFAHTDCIFGSGATLNAFSTTENSPSFRTLSRC